MIMNEKNKNIALKYYEQAEYFIVAAELASNHAKANYFKNPTAFNNFEAVIVGTHHAFSAELLIKGIIFFNEGKHPKNQHKLKDLLKHDSCRELKKSIKKEFQPELHISNTKESFKSLLKQYSSNLDKKDKSDNNESKTLERIMSDIEFGSFDNFLDIHSNHFVKMRYACEKDPPPLDMNFTSFLIERLRSELKKLLGL
jgi:HEPN domain-containing protein